MSSNKGFALHEFYSRIFKQYDLINRLFTFGQDQRWRKITAKLCLENKPGHILDLCCGTGDLTLQLLAHTKSNVSITGYDFNDNMLNIAREKVKRKYYRGLDFIQGDAANMPFENEQFDAITIGFGFRNLTYNNTARDKHISEMYRVLSTGGKLYILESSVPENIIIRIFYRVYLYLFLIPLGTILSGDFKAYRYLAKSSAEFYSLEETRKILLKGGFSKLESKNFMFGATNLIIVYK